MKRSSTTLHKMIEENKREILSSPTALGEIEKKIDTKIIANAKKQR